MFEFFKIKKKSMKIEERGERFPFRLLNENTMEYRDNRHLRVLRIKNGEKYWENMKPYEIINGDLCVRAYGNFSEEYYGGWIVLSKDEVTKILSEMYHHKCK